jgi:O-antigen/teichoic acid export membrane protein
VITHGFKDQKTTGQNLRHFIDKLLKGDGTRARVIRSSAWVLIGFGGANVLRLVSNLILTRLLFPEAFGLMALVQVFMIGLAMFSDLGLNVSIIQNKRGEDPDFLNTAWSIQIIRGVVLWIGACALAYPAAQIYNEPLLAQLLPVVGLTAVIKGFQTTKIPLANRNLQIGVQTSTELGSQFISLAITALLAWVTGSVWSLVIGGLIGTTIGVIAQHVMLKGPANRWYIGREMAWDIIHFGKYIFLSSIAGFLISQSDRAILGGYVSMADLGIFTVGYLFASVPLLLTQAADSRILQPLYRKFLTSENAENRNKVGKARRIILISMTTFSGLLSLCSIPLIETLYDARYHMAGPIMTLMGFAVTARIATSSYDGAYHSHGDSRGQFFVNIIQAALQVGLSFLLISRFGLAGAVLVLGMTSLLSYPFRAWLAACYQAWTPGTDALAFLIGTSLNLLAIWVWHDNIQEFFLTL